MKNILIRRGTHPFLLHYDLKMKLTTLFLIVSLFQTQATTSFSEDVTITMSLKNVRLEKALNRIETLTD